MTDLPNLAARYRLGLLDSESLVRIAERLLSEGRDTPALIQLCILPSPIMADVGPLFERLFVESGISVPSKQEAIGALLRHHIEEIACGAGSPDEPLSAIMFELWPLIGGESCKLYVGDSRGLEHLVGAYYAYEVLLDRSQEASWAGKLGEEAISAWEESVRSYARDWLRKYPV